MKAWLRKWNENLKGWRGILTTLGTYVLIYAGSFFDSVTGIDAQSLKGAAITATPIAIKLIWTDARPRIQAWLNS